MTANRYDKTELKATRTDEGYLIDTPIVGRVGIQLYRKADGSVQRELRPPEEVFNADSLASFAGKPITDEHPSEQVTAKNVKALSVGTMQGEAKADGDNVVAPIIIHDADMVDKVLKGGKRELSLGYKVDLDETPGVWNGQEYDAIQRNIRVNHLAVVPRGRAGNARLNLDRCDAVSINQTEDFIMPDTKRRIRLDTGIDYEADAEVAVAFDKMRADNVELNAHVSSIQGQMDTIAAERDSLKSQVANLPQLKEDALKEARAEVAARSALVAHAADFKIDCEGKTDRQVKEAVILSVRADAALADKSDEYINASFDLAVGMRKDAAIAAQRAAGSRTDSNTDTKPAGYAGFMAQLGSKE